MAQENEITTGDVVCLKSERDKGNKQLFTVGNEKSKGFYYLHWYHEGELKSQSRPVSILHKLF